MEALLRVTWHLAIFDEAHVLKAGSQVFQAAMHLPTKRRYGLTGTAMQVDVSLELLHVNVTQIS